jgi:DNA polymerase III epsilon subunit-like protein
MGPSQVRPPPPTKTTTTTYIHLEALGFSYLLPYLVYYRLLWKFDTIFKEIDCILLQIYIQMTSFFYFDLETSGTNPYYDDIIEIGLQTSDGKHSFSVLVNPNYEVSDTITYITGITNDLLKKEGISLREAILAMHAFLRKHTVGRKLWLVGHNVYGFDRIFYE